MEIAKKYLFEFLYLFNEMAIYLLIGFLFAGILHVFIRKERVAKYLGRNDFGSVINASLLGVPLPLCSCGVIPAGLSFLKNGAFYDIDQGVEPDYYIDNISNLYNREALTAFINGLF